LCCVIGAEPQLAQRSGRYGNRLVGGQDSQTAALQMRTDQAGDQFDRGRVERHIRFIEHPQRAPFMYQTGERGAALLPL
jgi:hypothetical protein